MAHSLRNPTLSLRYRQRMSSSGAGLPPLSSGEWAILGLVTEQPRHGFALARLMAPGGEIGQVWALPKPLVYRALSTLQERGLVAAAGEEPGERGPHRTLLSATGAGAETLRAWLDTPVDHLREVRSLLMLKLALLARTGGDVAPLLTAQRERLGPLLAALEARVAAAEAFEHTLLVWRLESARAALRFIDAVAASASSVAGRAPAEAVPSA
jgi:DNA-binding PadR family transcriptional regulator